MRALASLGVNPETSAQALDRIAAMACRLRDAPVVIVNLVGADKQRFLGCGGTDPSWVSVRAMPLTHGFCPFALGVEDAFAFADAPRRGGRALRPAAGAEAIDPEVRVPLEVASEPGFLPTRSDVRDRFGPAAVPDAGSVALLPLGAGDDRLGVLGVSFADVRALAAEDHDYLEAIAGLSLARAST